ncbi:MAG: DUF4118 domain-containing protein [Rubrivivax sp.]|nr:DUF4118 domain-containing protein [Rubrivivax sp.]
MPGCRSQPPAGVALVYSARVPTDLSPRPERLGASAWRRAAPSATLAGPRRRWRGYAGAGAFCVAGTLLAAPLATVLDAASLVLVFMLVVVLAAASFGRGPALLAAGLSVLLFNVMFVPPRFSLSVADERFLFTFAVMLAVGLVVGQLTAGLRAQAQAASRRERQVRSLYDISRDLGRALAADQVAEIVERFARQQFGAGSVLWVTGRPGGLELLRGAPDADLAGRARAAVGGHARPGPPAPSPQAPGCLVLPLPGTMAVRGALALQRPGAAGWSAEDRELLDTCGALVGSTLERIHYIDVARESAVQIEGERLRNTLLAAISHDLRTPLASLVGLSEALRLTRPPPTAEQADIAGAMGATARRMSALVANLLDLARIESGALRLDRQWQPVEEVIGSAIAAAAGALPAHRVHVRVAEGMPLVHLDAVLMERVLVNLLENAAKYTPETSRVQISAALDGDAFELVVADDGPGLPAGRRADLFRKFERGERESATPGAGLGLALCRAIVEAHGGRIDAGDAPGGGARFTLRLPLGTPPPMPALESTPEEAGR